MNMRKFLISYTVDGKSGYETYVDAQNPSTAKNIAKGEISGKPGYAGKRIGNVIVRKEIK